MTEQQKFLLWQYADLCANIERAQQESGTEEIVEVMLGEKARMEDERSGEAGTAHGFLVAKTVLNR